MTIKINRIFLAEYDGNPRSSIVGLHQEVVPAGGPTSGGRPRRRANIRRSVVRPKAPGSPRGESGCVFWGFPDVWPCEDSRGTGTAAQSRTHSACVELDRPCKCKICRNGRICTFFPSAGWGLSIRETNRKKEKKRKRKKRKKKS